MKILTVFGTRPEAIKMAPVVLALKKDAYFDTKVCVTGQHGHLLDQVLTLFGLQPDFNLKIMTPGQELTDITTRVLLGMVEVYKKWTPDLILVHGDTTTSFAASLSAFYAQIRVGHVEAGLRTHNKYAPWPEEINRSLTGVLADVHFASTITARHNLLAEGKAAASIHVTGNTVIDALLEITGRIGSNTQLQDQLAHQFDFIDPKKRLIIVTGHRRENFGPGLENICQALKKLARRSDIQIVYPVHLNPQVQEPVQRILDGLENVHLTVPQDYLSFVYLMGKAYLILTDSGGIQEEAPSLGKPVLVLRATTERPEAIEAGTVKLVGMDLDTIVKETSILLTDSKAYQAMAQAHNPYGDGQAARRIVEIVKRQFTADREQSSGNREQLSGNREQSSGNSYQGTGKTWKLIPAN